jgi:hypothetical protein
MRIGRRKNNNGDFVNNVVNVPPNWLELAYRTNRLQRARRCWLDSGGVAGRRLRRVSRQRYTDGGIGLIASEAYNRALSLVDAPLR